MKNEITVWMMVALMAVSGNVEAQRIAVWQATDLKTAIDTTTAPTIFNFWATFCKPCIAELPYFQKLADKYSANGLKLILVSLDLKDAYPKQIAKFANARRLHSPIMFLDEPNADLFVPLVDTSWSGAIPASLFLNKAKGYRKFLEEELTPQQLDAEIKNMLAQ